LPISLLLSGRTPYPCTGTAGRGEAPLPGTVAGTAELVTRAGGKGIAVACDHSLDRDVARLFAKVKKEQKGRLDILVNNATFLHDKLIDKGPFWEKPIDLVDILDVGLRSAYIASWFAAPLMAARKNGLIVFTSSFGSSCYMHGPGYGAQKVGVDKFAKDMAVDLKPVNVAAVSIWMGMLKTDRTRRVMDQDPQKYAPFWEIAETPEFTGHLISAIYRDPRRQEKSGQVLIGAEAALDYGIKDEGGKQPPSHRQFLGAPQQAHPAIVE
jgi:NAD(P)-dependent dehydrogenase (short-subunit alcohol dehydrogenase family)